MARSLEVGDRVRARTSLAVPAGTLGSITLILISVSDMYFVQFDGHHRAILMRGDELELVIDAPTDADAN